MIPARLSRLASDVQMGPMRRRYIAELRRSASTAVDDYEDLHPNSLALMGSTGRSATPVIRLLLPVGAPHAMFAGMRTALVFAARLAHARSMPLEIRHFDRPRSSRQKAQLRELAAELSGISADRVSVSNVWSAGPTHPEDVYVATFWETALAAQVSAECGAIDPSRVLYLVQDYEPEFYAGSSESALAKATYHAGFRLIVNSRPLASYLAVREGVQDRIEQVFRPELDLRGVELAAANRTRSQQVRIAFYGRPGNSRNSYELGVASLRVASRRLARSGIDAHFVSVGEKHADISLPNGRRARSLGKLAWDEYFRFLGATDVMLSFQQTPHPSHPPLDAVASGGYAVVNDMGGSRSGLSPRLLAVESSPVPIAVGLVEASRRVLSEGPLDGMDVAFVEGLGTPLSDVVDDLAAHV